MFMLRIATRVQRLAFLRPIRFQGTAPVIVVVGVMADMLDCSRTFLVQAIRCNSSGSPLQWQKQNEKGDY